MGGVFEDAKRGYELGKDRAWRDIKRGGLAVLTGGTSEIKTGGGANGDETVADTLFPTKINDLLLEDRTDARKKTAEEAAAEEAALDAAKPTLTPDLTDETIAKSKRAQALRGMTGRGRSSTFLTGPLGATNGATGKKTLMGGY